MKTALIVRFSITLLLVLIIFALWPLTADAAEQQYPCEPTMEDEMGPFYRPDAPYRNSIGVGYLLMGTVISANDCRPIPGAQIELWMTGSDGHYDDDWRATLLSSDNGTYHFVSNTATDYGRRRPHIHIRVTAQGFVPLVTQHYPVKGAGEGMFDLVIRQVESAGGPVVK